MARNTVLSVVLALPVLLSAALGQSRFATLYTFTGDNPAGLTYANGVFYGATNYIFNCGTIFELQPPAAPGGAWTVTTLYTFAITGGDPCSPIVPPALGPSGALYGVSYAGGAYTGGAVYELQPPASPGGAWTEKIIYNFTGLGQPGGDGGSPEGFIMSRTGSLYIPTTDGGIYEEGSVFQLTPPATPGAAWTGTVLYSFPGFGPAGAITDSVAFGPKGMLYGANQLGAAPDAGTVFELAPPNVPGGAWREATLYIFRGFSDGAVPNNVIEGPHGALYGTTMGSTSVSEYGIGSVFQLTPSGTPGTFWTKTILKSFGYNFNCGPDSPLILRDGNLYGAACQYGGGVVFKLQPPSASGGEWTFTALHTFTDGQTPYGGMVVTQNGTIYGTTINLAYTQPYGTIYEIVP